MGTVRAHHPRRTAPSQPPVQPQPRPGRHLSSDPVVRRLRASVLPAVDLSFDISLDVARYLDNWSTWVTKYSVAFSPHPLWRRTPPTRIHPSAPVRRIPRCLPQSRGGWRVCRAAPIVPTGSPHRWAPPRRRRHHPRAGWGGRRATLGPSPARTPSAATCARPRTRIGSTSARTRASPCGASGGSTGPQRVLGRCSRSAFRPPAPRETRRTGPITWRGARGSSDRAPRVSSRPPSAAWAVPRAAARPWRATAASAPASRRAPG